MIIWNQNTKKKQSCVHTDIFIVYIITEDIYVDIAKEAKSRLKISNNELERQLPIGKKVIGLTKDDLGKMIMTERVAFKPIAI